jgi:hypothetical protein
LERLSMSFGTGPSIGSGSNVAALQLLQAQLQQRQSHLSSSATASAITNSLRFSRAAEPTNLFTALATSLDNRALSFLNNAASIASQANASNAARKSLEKPASVVGAAHFLAGAAAALHGIGTLAPDAAAAVSGIGTLLADRLGSAAGIGTLSADALGLVEGTGTLAADALGSLNGTGTFSADAAASVSGIGTLSADALGSVNGIGTFAADAAAAVNGTGTLAADAAASVSGTGTLAADAAASVSGTGTLSADALGSVNGIGTFAADAAASVNGTGTLNNQSNLNAQGITQGQTLTVKVGSGALQTITFGILPGQVNTLAQLQTALSGLTGLSAVSVNTTNGGVALTSSTTAALTIGGTVNLSKFGLAAGTYNPTNLLTQGINQGQTLTVQVANGSTQTITFGTNTGQVATLAGLQTALSSLTGLGSASASLSNGGVSLTAANTGSPFTIGGNAALSKFGLTAGTYGTDLLTQGINQNQTLTVQVGGGSNQTITFGTGNGQVATLAQLQSALSSLTGLSAESINLANGGISLATSSTASLKIGGSVALSKFGLASGTYNPTNLLTQGINQNQTLTVQVGSAAAQTITFGTGAGQVQTLAQLQTALSALTGLSSESLSLTNGGIALATNSTTALTIGGNAALSKFGLTSGTYSPTNLLTQGITQGQTLTVRAGSGAVQTITFGTGAGQVETLAQLQTALSGLSGLSTASVNATNGGVSLATSSTTSLAIGGTANLAKFGLSAGTYNPTNLLTQGISQGQTLTLAVANGPAQTITFGTGSGQVATLAQLQTALSSLTGLGNESFDVSNGGISLTAANTSSPFTIGGTATLSKFGISAGTYGTDLLTQGISQGQTLTVEVGNGAAQTITFGTGSGQVATLAGLQTALSSLTGLSSASIDLSKGGISLEAADGISSVTIGGTATLSKFGLAAGTYDPTNLLTQGINQGQTLTVQVGNGAAQTLTFGTGSGQVATLAQLQTALSSFTGLASESVNGGNGGISLTAANTSSPFTIGGTATLSNFGIAAGTYGTDLLTQGISQGQTLTVAVANRPAQTITFGTDSGQVATLAQLQTALSSLSGLGSAGVNVGNGGISLTAANTGSPFTIGGNVTLSKFGLTAGTYGTDLLTQGISQDETLTVQVGNGATQTITFGTGSGQVATLAGLQTALSSLSELGSEGINLSNGGLSLSAADTSSPFTIGGTAALSKFGLTPGTYGTNLLTQGISQGQTLTVQVGDGATQTITFGTESGQVATLAQLQTALSAVSGLGTESVDLTNGGISLKSGNSSSPITIGGTAKLSKFGLAAGTHGTDLLTQGIGQGQTLTVQVGNGPIQTITFGTGTGQVATLAGLQSALSSLTGLAAASVDLTNGGISLVAANTSSPITIGGTAALPRFGLATGTYNPTNLLTQGISQGQTLTVKVGSHPAQTITFGSEPGQVSTLAQLQTGIAALQHLADPGFNLSNGMITLTAANSTDSITIDGTLALSKLGLRAGVTKPPPASGTPPNPALESYRQISPMALAQIQAAAHAGGIDFLT